MTKYKHIVQVHPVANDKVNLSKVVDKGWFIAEDKAKHYVDLFNKCKWMTDDNIPVKAVYLGRVNYLTGELE